MGCHQSKNPKNLKKNYIVRKHSAKLQSSSNRDSSDNNQFEENITQNKFNYFQDNCSNNQNQKDKHIIQQITTNYDTPTNESPVKQRVTILNFQSDEETNQTDQICNYSYQIYANANNQQPSSINDKAKSQFSLNIKQQLEKNNTNKVNNQLLTQKEEQYNQMQNVIRQSQNQVIITNDNNNVEKRLQRFYSAEQLNVVQKNLQNKNFNIDMAQEVSNNFDDLNMPNTDLAQNQDPIKNSNNEHDLNQQFQQNFSSKFQAPIQQKNVQSSNKKLGGRIMFSMKNLLKDPNVKKKIMEKKLQIEKSQQHYLSNQLKSPQKIVKQKNFIEGNQTPKNFNNEVNNHTYFPHNINNNAVNNYNKASNNNNSNSNSNNNLQNLNNFLEENFGILTIQKQQEQQQQIQFKSQNQISQF